MSEEHKEDETTQPPPTDPPKDPVSTNPPSSGTSGGTGSADDDKLRAMVKEVVAEALSEHKPERPGVVRRADIETMAEQMVREAAEKLAADEKHKKDHEEMNKKPVTEQLPQKVNKLRKALWGDD